MAHFTGNLILVQFSTAMITHYSLVFFFIVEYFQSSVWPMTNNIGEIFPELFPN